MTDNFPESSSRRSITLEPPHVETPQESLDRLRLEVEELRASRERLVLAADADRRSDRARPARRACSSTWSRSRSTCSSRGQLADVDPAAAKALLDEMGRDVQQALDETARLAQRIYPPLLGAGGLAAALRAAAVSAGVPAPVDVAADARYPPEIAGAVYFCCLEALEHAGDGARATVTVRDERGRARVRGRRGTGAGSPRPAVRCGTRPPARPRRGARRPADDPVRARSRHPGLRLAPALAMTLARSPPGRGSRP